jgi:hypothetical protein
LLELTPIASNETSGKHTERIATVTGLVVSRNSLLIVRIGEGAQWEPFSYRWFPGLTPIDTLSENLEQEIGTKCKIVEQVGGVMQNHYSNTIKADSQPDIASTQWIFRCTAENIDSDNLPDGLKVVPIKHATRSETTPS